ISSRSPARSCTGPLMPRQRPGSSPRSPTPSRHGTPRSTPHRTWPVWAATTARTRNRRRTGIPRPVSSMSAGTSRLSRAPIPSRSTSARLLSTVCSPRPDHSRCPVAGAGPRTPDRTTGRDRSPCLLDCSEARVRASSSPNRRSRAPTIAMREDRMALRPGAIVGGYRVIKVLGSGGMGTVYLAQNPILPRRDALKVLSAELSTDAEFRARFEREANLAAGLDHPNIVTVYNRGEEDGQLWIAMQYVDGVDAAAETAKGPAVMTPQRALRIVSEVGKGLDYAHRRGLLHRDIKPANFLLSTVDSEDEERVLLTDFGVAKSAEDGQELTATGNFMATVAYASPEQLLGERLDHRSDIYSLGCSFYRMLTGQNPYPSTVPAVVMMG